MTPRSVAVFVLTRFGVPCCDREKGILARAGAEQRCHQKGRDDD